MPGDSGGVRPTGPIGFICPKCNDTVSKKSLSVSCGYCTSVYHAKCADLTDETADIIKKSPTIEWFCHPCHAPAVRILAEWDKYVKRTEDNFGRLTTAIENLSDKVLHLTTQYCPTPTLSSNSDVNEIIDILERQQNVIVYGLPESTDKEHERNDVSMLLADELVLPSVSVQAIDRLGRSADPDRGPRPLRIKLASRSERNSVLGSAKRLRKSKNESVRRVYISPDL